jgi:DNA-binding HxlR family transcriptional regulator
LVYKSFLVTFGDCKGITKKINPQEGTCRKHSHQMETITAFTEHETQKKISNFFEMKTTEMALCPVKDVLSTVGDKWSVLVMVTLGKYKTMRFNELKHAIGSISQKMLTVTLREMESFGLINREIFPQIPPKVEYTITPMGEEFLRHLVVMLEWACVNSYKIAENRKKVK